MINVARVDVRDIIITVEIILFSYNPWSLTSYTMDYIYRNIIRFIATFLTFIPIANLYDFGFVDSIIILSYLS